MLPFVLLGRYPFDVMLHTYSSVLATRSYSSLLNEIPSRYTLHFTIRSCAIIGFVSFRFNVMEEHSLIREQNRGTRGGS